ncbi:MAG: hypothetical protein NTX46_03635 [Chloroflexi bacterium]|nr:hypothetical protein [Chloroflexota bacterium]
MPIIRKTAKETVSTRRATIVVRQNKKEESDTEKLRKAIDKDKKAVKKFMKL